MISKNNPVKLFSAISITLLVSFLFSCSASKNFNGDFLYFQKDLDSTQVQFKETVIQPSDLLNIRVYSTTLNQEQTAVFNIQSSQAATSPAGNSSNYGYIVDMYGYIDLPIIGRVKAAGLTKKQLQSILEEKLTLYVKQPSVIINFLQFNVNVLGEVKSPGTHSFRTDRVTIIDAIGAANDLTDYGKRKNVLVIREEDGVRKYFNIDLTSGDLFKSPVYQLQPNDIVYVSANKNKLRLLNVNPDAQRKTGLAFSLISVAATVVTLIFTLKK